MSIRLANVLTVFAILFGPLAVDAADDPPPAKDPVPAAPLINFDNPKRIPGSYFVAFKDEAEMRVSLALHPHKEQLPLPDKLPLTYEDGELVARALTEKGRGVDVRVFMRRTGGIQGFWVSMSEEEVKKLSTDPRVKYVEANLEVSVNTTESLPSSNSFWHLDRIDQRSLGLDHQYHFDPYAVGSPITVYVVDTGVRTTHSEFHSISDNVLDCGPDTGSGWLCGPHPGESSEAPTIGNGSPDAQDCNGHGTAVASLIAGWTTGIARDAHIKPIKFTRLCTGSGDAQTLSFALYAVLFDTDEKGVVNLSIRMPAASSPAWTQTNEDLISQIVGLGASVVVAAGNDSSDACDYTPARMSGFDDVITVAGSTRSDRKVSESNFGSCISLFAPGDDFSAAGIGSDSDIDNGFVGTSFASPIVAGIVAVYKGLHPNDSALAVKQAILGTASVGKLSNIGVGSPNKLAYSIVPGVDVDHDGYPGAQSDDDSPDEEQQGFAVVLQARLVIG